jgi:DNA-binding PadR family transcriptional regulator
MGERLSREQTVAALRSPISWALLGLVIQRPSYGYELVQRFERTYGEALELSSPSQIYTALDTLAHRSLIEELPGDEAPAPGRQPKPHYRPTKGGVRSYEEWLVAQIHEERKRSWLFARQLANLAPTAAVAIVKRCEQACLQAAAAEVPAGQRESAEGGLAARLLSEEGRLALDARLAWLEYARREMTSQAATPPPAP